MSKINHSDTLTDNQDLNKDTPNEAFGQFNGAKQDTEGTKVNETKQVSKKSIPPKAQNNDKNDEKKNDKNIWDKARKEHKEKETNLISLISKQYNCDLDSFLKMPLPLHDDPEKTTDMIDLKDQILSLKEEYKVVFAEEVVVDDFNKKHAVVFYGKTQFMRIKEEDGSISLECRKSLIDYYENKYCIIDGKPKRSVNIWLQSRRRTTYEAMKMIPTNDPEELRKIKDKGIFNLWKGFKISTRKGVGKGKDGRLLYWDHVFDNICSGNPEYYKFIRRYIAHMFQKPDVLPETAIILIGNHGTGKDSFAEPLLDLLDKHAIELTDMTRLTCKFNWHLFGKILAVVSEAEWTGDQNEKSRLKSIITGKQVAYEGKNQNIIEESNYIRMMFFSNNPYPMELEAGQRRFFTLQVSNNRQQDTVYFGALKDELKNGGLEILLHDLLNEPLVNFNPRLIPESEATFDLKLASPNATVERYMQKVLEEGLFGVGVPTSGKPWGLIKKDDAFNDFKAWCESNNETYKNITKEVFTKKLKALFPSLNEDCRKRIEGYANQIRHYEFPELNTCRKEFCKNMKISFEVAFKGLIKSSESAG